MSTLLLFVANQPARAGSATWNLNPTSGDWNTATNWTPATVPNSATDVATFGVSDTTAVGLSTSVLVDSIIFEPGASAYTITASTGTVGGSLTLGGAGIVNNSGLPQNFVVTSWPSSQAIFTGTSTAGSMTTFYNQPGGTFGLTPGEQFQDKSSADHATFITDGSLSQSSTFSGQVQFLGTSTAGNGTFINNPGATNGGFTGFFDSSKAGNGTIICNGGTATQHFGGVVSLSTKSSGDNGVFIANAAGAPNAQGGQINIIFSASAGSATLIANGGQEKGGHISYSTSSEGGGARIELFGNGTLDVSSPVAPVTTIGSLEGDGLVFLGGKNLSVGFNRLSTTFSGVIADGGSLGGVGGSLTKIGVTSFELSGANTYTGGTTVNAGTLIVSNRNGSGTGTGAVSITADVTLGGSGIISGAVTLFNGAFLAPAHGTKAQSTFTIQSPLIFNTGSTYTYTFKAKGNKAKTDKVIANGVTINSGATFNFSGTAQGTLTQGLVLTAISNTAATPIAGSFSNLADGAILTVGANHFQASYEGGGGNDLTLTVVP
ncbi:MAG: beta strand repeat-containing protein [Chthoniobacterales bacterium]